ncbi:MAG: porin family protein [Ignavibacteria bacterium]|nr:porin family protein [Ignavibacteria bacterium]
MKAFICIVFLAASSLLCQQIGQLAPPKAGVIFPSNSAGVDIVMSEGGFGIGGFYRYAFQNNFTVSMDLSFSEAKDPNEEKLYNPYTGDFDAINKKNRIFMLPLLFGVQYRLFSDDLTDNFRPYVCASTGPTMVITTPYSDEFFTSFKKAAPIYALGSYIGFGANVGLSKTSLAGISVRYYIVHMFNGGVEGLYNRFQNDIGGVFITLNIGTMF